MSRILAPVALRAPSGDLRFDPALGWVQRPGNTSIHVNEAGTVVAVYGTALGIRQPSADYRTEDVDSILVLGDSTTAGTQLPFEDTWPAVLGKRLAARAGRVQVVNAGIDGYDLAQEYWLADRLWARFKPVQLVVALYVGNDFIDYEHESVVLPPWGGSTPRAWLRQHSYLYNLASSAKRAWNRRGVAQASSRATDDVPSGEWVPTSVLRFETLALDSRRRIRRQLAAADLIPVLRNDDEASRRVRSTERVLECLAALAAAREARFTVVVLPFKLQVIPEQRDEWMSLHHLSTGQALLPQDRLRSWAIQKHIRFVDVSEDFLRHPLPRSLFWPIDDHYSAAGHAVVAEALALALENPDGTESSN